MVLAGSDCEEGEEEECFLMVEIGELSAGGVMMYSVLKD
jgi:hypothetical protein